MSTSSVSEKETQSILASKLNKCYYQDEQLTKFMHLQAEVDCLLEQLQSMKTEKSITNKEE
ncbi:MAG: hypothetical protein KME49_00715 [Brasilonema octagenarum HA4186-MV1]|jgi:hypothetical protein|uniref:Uncharacterized protein n=2 Tax=Brasilonema TaxID=383614 RepID=A0A856MIT1_9CYAN|nr:MULTISPECIES: hypothetical protein [Brasilonema]MBW4624058.1 hypothetical protein [Brasilonema octagenarum HA4186-MV1]NMF63582.1 hypothetical protein [Brasilonema octagenarum UFV-OR1]QDL08886.1 hypothetical protein DP114_14150 [Brasilonema sennae CENA114]QDL15243.1 hypothetical protein DP113_14090 [Brasilonema octagenarum UFV-E1]